MTWLWLDVVASRAHATDALGTAALRTVEGGEAGWLAWWAKTPGRPTPRALRVDERLAAGGGQATWLSWCRFPADESLAFDDGAVAGAVRRRLAMPWPEAASTLLVDWSRVAGAITTGVERRAVEEDPFERVFPQRLLRLEAGALGPIPAPTGPGITRYGSGNPWPWDRYAGQVR